MYNNPSVCAGYVPNNCRSEDSRYNVLYSSYRWCLLILTICKEAPKFSSVYLTGYQLCNTTRNWNAEVAYTSISLFYGLPHFEGLHPDSLIMWHQTFWRCLWSLFLPSLEPPKATRCHTCSGSLFEMQPYTSWLSLRPTLCSRCSCCFRTWASLSSGVSQRCIYDFSSKVCNSYRVCECWVWYLSINARLKLSLIPSGNNVCVLEFLDYRPSEILTKVILPQAPPSNDQPVDAFFERSVRPFSGWMVTSEHSFHIETTGLGVCSNSRRRHLVVHRGRYIPDDCPAPDNWIGDRECTDCGSNSLDQRPP